MPEQDPNAPYRDAVANLRETTKWIISSFAGLAALLIGTSPLNGLGALSPGTWRWFTAGISSLVDLGLTTLVLFLAMRVMASGSGIGFGELVHDNRYRRHREDMLRQRMIQFPAAVHSLEDLETAHNRAEAQAENHPTNADAEAEVLEYRQLITLALTIARWIEVSYRFRCLMRGLIGVLFPILASIYVFVWAANPPKDKTATSSPIDLSVVLPPSAGPAPTVHVAPSGVVLDCGDKEKPVAVGPFIQGYVTLEPGAADVNAAVEALANRQQGRALVALVLIGSADKVPLKPDFAQQFGSNEGLAQARAEWVRQHLVASDAWPNLHFDDPSKIMSLVAGPARVGVKISPPELALDRQVRLCALWQVGQDSH